MQTSEFDEQSYYPSAKVRITLRFEEYGDTKALTAEVPKKPSKNIKGAGDKRDNLVWKEITDERGLRVIELGTRLRGDTSQGVGTEQQRSKDGRTFEIAGIIPKSATWKQNDIRTADTLSLQLRWQDMPFDPRTVRSATVEFFLGCVRPEDFAGGIAGSTRSTSRQGPGYAQGTEALNLIPDTWTDDWGRARTNLRFQGWIDKWELSWDEDDEPTVQLECVDNTRLLIDQKHAPQAWIDPVLPIDEGVADYLSFYPQMAGLRVEYRPSVSVDDRKQGKLVPVPKTIFATTANPPRLGPPVSKTGGGNDAATCLDYIQDVCGAMGHKCFIEGTTFVIQSLDSVYSIEDGRKADTYVGRATESGHYPYRAFIYGRNILKLKVKREFARKKVENIEVRCYDPAKKTILVGRYPLKNPEAKKTSPTGRANNPNPGDGKTEQKWDVRIVGGITDKATLDRFAKNIYEGIGRQEIAISLETRNLASFGGNNADPDLFDIGFGDAITLLIDRNATSTISEIEQSSVGFITGLGHSQELAQAYNEAYSNRGLQTTFRVKESEIAWSTEDGVNVKIEAYNFVEVRAGTPEAAPRFRPGF